MGALKACPSCKNNVSKSAKTCPHCGHKLKGSWFGKLVVMLIAAVFILSFFDDSAEQVAEQIEVIKNTKPSALALTELSAAFSPMSTYTEAQRDTLRDEMKGQVVQWRVIVQEVSRQGEGYALEVGADSLAGQFGAIASLFVSYDAVDAQVKIYPQTDKEREFISSLKKLDNVTIKGKITGLSFTGKIKVSPAIVIMN